MTETAEPEEVSASTPAAPTGAAVGVLDQVRERGFITTGEIFAAFPDLEPDTNELRELWEMFESRGIKVLDEIAEELQLEDERRTGGAGAERTSAPPGDGSPSIGPAAPRAPGRRHVAPTTTRTPTPSWHRCAQQRVSRTARAVAASIRCACTSRKSAKSRCSPPSKKSRSRSASRPVCSRRRPSTPKPPPSRWPTVAAPDFRPCSETANSHDVNSPRPTSDSSYRSPSVTSAAGWRYSTSSKRAISDSSGQSRNSITRRASSFRPMPPGGSAKPSRARSPIRPAPFAFRCTWSRQ